MIREPAEQTSPLIKENSDHGPLHGPLQIRVGENDIGRFSAQLQSDFFQIAGCRPLNPLADFGAAGKGDHIDIAAFGQLLPDRASGTHNQVCASRRNAQTVEHLKKQNRSERGV